MRSYHQDAIADGSHVSFDPTHDTLSFSGTGLSAADVQFTMAPAATGLLVTAAGKSYTLEGTSLTTVEGSSFLFDHGSALVNAAADNGYGHELQGTVHDDLLIGGPPKVVIAAVAVSLGGAQPDGPSTRGVVSADGHFVAFTSYASDLVNGRDSGLSDIFIKNLQTGAIRLVSSTADGGLATADSSLGSDNAVVSADGRFVAFVSYANNLVPHDTNGLGDIFVKDTLTGEITRASTSASGGQGTGGAWGSYYLSMSADGRYVAFVSDETGLVNGDTNNQADIFVKDLKTGSIVRASTNAAGGQAKGDFGATSHSPTLSSDGRFVVFSSALTGLVAGDHDNTEDCFVKDLKTGAITRIARGSSEVTLSSDGHHVAIAQGGTISTMDLRTPERVTHVEGFGPKLSGDGRYLGFSRTNPDQSFDAFVEDVLTGKIVPVALSASGHRGNGNAFFDSLSADGSSMTFHGEATNLVKGYDTGSTEAFIVYNPLDTRTLAGGDGNDTYLIQRTADRIVETAGGGIDTVRSSISLTLADNVEKLVLLGDADLQAMGNGERNTLTGNSGSNTLDGGAAADILAGGGGDDTYVVDNAGDRVVERAGGGIDTVRSSVDTVLAAEVEVLRLEGSANIDGTGNALDNTVYGNAGNNVLDGQAGIDTVSYADAGGAVQVSLAVTAAQATGAAGTDTLKNIENLTGSAYADTLTGNARANLLDGGAGADRLTGGAGDDTYVVDQTGDVIVEQADGGTDTVLASVSGITLQANVENLQLLGKGSLAGTGNALDNVLTGTAGNNRLDGADGFDTVSYGNAKAAVQVSLAIGTAQNTRGAGSDTLIHVEALIGSAFDDRLTGSAADNRLEGGAGNDLIDGGQGTDTMIGGAGDDTYVVDQATDRVSEAGGGGIDQVLATASFRLSAGIETLHLLGAGDIDGTGSAHDNLLIGNAGDNRLDGGAGNDTVSYAEAEAGITVSLDSTASQATGGAGRDTLRHIENLIGSAHDDVIAGDEGDNRLDGGDGIDMLSYAAATQGVRVSLAMTGVQSTGGAGHDQISGFEQLAGSAHDDTLIGNAGANLIDGRGGADRMSGGAGDDSYRVDDSGDVIVETAGGGHDSAEVAVTWTMSAGVEDATVIGDGAVSVTGNSLDNTLVGNAGANVLNGGAGADTLIGGAGDDSYTVDNVGDSIVERATEGHDTVYTSVTWTLGDNLEDLSMYGNKAIDATGNALDNQLTGNKSGNVLDGGAGADVMSGGYGNDTYIVDNIGDVVIDVRGIGHDTVKSSVSFDLGPTYAEALELTGTAAIDGHGNLDNNRINGNAANNLLDGGGGADTLIGGRGNDTYVVDNAHDVVVENASAGVDSVQSGVSYALAANIENLRLTGLSAETAIGNALANTISGNSLANTLTGGGGRDTFAFDLDLPTDTVTDFVHGVDHLLLRQAGHAIGDGDTRVDGAVRLAKPGGFSSDAELVIETRAVHGALSADAAAGAIGSAQSAYAVGDTAVFVVGNGHDSGVYLFTSADDDATVSADELQWLANLAGTPSLGTSDVLFGG